MTILAIIDLDGVVADAQARVAKAEEIKRDYISKASTELYAASEREATNVYWRAVFDPEYVHLDTPIEGAPEALISLEHMVDEVLYLTSRPEIMREATQAWFRQHRIFSSHSSPLNRLIMKAPAFQYTKTVVWKAGMIQSLVALYEADEVIVIDDEGINLAELQRYDTSAMRLYSSLAEALAPPAPDASEEHPF